MVDRKFSFLDKAFRSEQKKSLENEHQHRIDKFDQTGKPLERTAKSWLELERDIAVMLHDTSDRIALHKEKLKSGQVPLGELQAWAIEQRDTEDLITALKLYQSRVARLSEEAQIKSRHETLEPLYHK